MVGISEDPIGLAGGINRFPYTENNPVNYIDPRGLYSLNEFMEDWSALAYISVAQNYWKNYGGPVGSSMSALISFSGAAMVQESGEQPNSFQKKAALLVAA
ncbi:MAG: RHS repeat-associated core domain-containing protein [Thermodesulfovibrionales bacterium]